MAFALSLFQKFGLFAPKSDTNDVFGLRLTRLGTREQRRSVRACVFIRPLA
jgi:hypothetical protein